MEKIRVALDWTPNINHIGFFVAQAKRFYADQSLEVEMISPAIDDYSVTPAKKVELGEAEFALCPMESILSYRTKEKSFGLKAVAAIYQEDLSAIVCSGKSGISSPKNLDGKSYASYQAKYEDELVKQMIINDGGQGSIIVSYPRKLGIWETILKGNHDSTWIFMNWEGIQAKGNNVQLTSFKMSDFGVPYSYSPVIAGFEDHIASHTDSYKRFLEATKQGFLFAATNPAEASKILQPLVSKSDQDIDIEAAINYSKDAFGNEVDWGKIEASNVKQYLEWIYLHQLESEVVLVKDLIADLW